ncbi:MAG: hypothetical protein IJ264_09740 [Clostridia bacterium]|nr:hypothetical protein [Clostridia bacterium]
MVIVFAIGFPMMYVNHLTSENWAYCAVGIPDGATLGVELTNVGFKVSNTESKIARSCSPLLNELGITYHYIAFR